jgi:hypothetical protein
VVYQLLYMQTCILYRITTHDMTSYASNYRSNYSPSSTLAHHSVTRHTAIAIAAVLRRIQLHLAYRKTAYTSQHAKSYTSTTTPPLHPPRLHGQFRHRNGSRARFGSDLSLNCSSPKAILLAFCTSASRRLRYQPIACMHLASGLLREVVSRVPRSAGRISLGSPETFWNPTWTKTKGEI